MNGRPCNLLFLCTGNSARSILAEALMNRDAGGRFRAFSAGSHPKGEPHPMAIEILASLGFATDGLRSKSWDEFAAPGAPPIDFIITVCDNAAGEMCPVWPGRPMIAHWGIDDPAAVDGAGQRDAFLHAFHALRRRISAFLQLPIGTMGRQSLELRLRDIGTMGGAEPGDG